MLSNWSFTKKFAASFSLILVVAATAFGLIYYNQGQVVRTVNEKASINRALKAIEVASTAMIQVSSQLRGFLITHEEALATGVATGRQEVETALMEADKAIASSEQKARIETMRSALDGYMREAADPEIRLARDPATRDQALALVFSGVSKRWINMFKTAANDLAGEEARRLGEADQIQTSSINSSYTALYAGGLAIFAVALIMGWLLNRQIAIPAVALTGSMRRLAGGDLSVQIEGLSRGDELGWMAKAVGIFKDNAIKLKASEEEAAAQRQTAERERAANEATRAEIQRQQEAVVASVATGLARLSKGDLTSRLSEAFSAEYEKLRADFNETADSLQVALTTIATAADGISSGSDQIAIASDDLSRRTEQQAANLEETSAALTVISGTVKAMAANASEASKVVMAARTSAESSGEIVRQAVDAMGKIKESSQQITNIIGVIDEIAFQTNLLALNAGVEAARAGDAGRGFAVVASEVRALAQRSAEAAKEIKGLISASTVQVESGVVLVDKTGAALSEIISKVADINELVRQISTASQEQATGISEISTAVTQMDQAVQQNAAMVEESTAAAHSLKTETQGLTDMVGRFSLGDATRRRLAVLPSGTAQSPAKNMSAQSSSFAHPKAVTAAKPTPRKTGTGPDSWAEF